MSRREYGHRALDVWLRDGGSGEAELASEAKGVGRGGTYARGQGVERDGTRARAQVISDVCIISFLRFLFV
jgi:hypothetical protein